MTNGASLVRGAKARVLLPLAGVLGVLAGAIALPACHGSGPVVSSDPAQPIYRSGTADLGALHGLAVHFVDVKTNTHEGEEFVRPVFLDSLTTWLKPRFGSVAEGSAAPAGGALLDVTITVNWGSRAARALVGMGAGSAGIILEYDLKDEHGNLLARMHTTDTMSGGFYGGDAKELVFAAASKWNKFFAEQVLAAPAGS